MHDACIYLVGAIGLLRASLPSALRAVLRTFKIAPGDFVELRSRSIAPSYKIIFSKIW